MDKILIGRASTIGQQEIGLITRKIGELAPAYTGTPVFSWVLEGKKLFVTVSQKENDK